MLVYALSEGWVFGLMMRAAMATAALPADRMRVVANNSGHETGTGGAEPRHRELPRIRRGCTLRQVPMGERQSQRSGDLPGP